MKQQKVLFIDRDGTLVHEPHDFQVDSLDKIVLLDNVIPCLLQLKKAGFQLVMVSNQDGIGSPNFPTQSFEIPHQFILHIFSSQGITFDAVRVCPHFQADNCQCRKPKLGLVQDFIDLKNYDPTQSYVIGDRDTDMQMAESIGISGFKIGSASAPSWQYITEVILQKPRTASIQRVTKETNINVSVNLDEPTDVSIKSGIGFFDHMLEQLAKHGGFGLNIEIAGDLHIDEHHTIEDCAIVLGEAIRTALGDKWGIARYGFLLPMHEALTKIALDISGRTYFDFVGHFNRERVGELPTELVPHFFRSLAEGLKANLHIEVTGENSHHMIEAIFKGVGRCLRQAIHRTDDTLPSTKGIL